jgi:YhcH/YjgK/YiaL family protein
VPLKPYPQERGEFHRIYADIQAPLSGPETIGVCDLPRRACEQPFDAKADYGLCQLKTKPLTLQPGEFAVFFPWVDAHMPGCTTDGAKSVKKLVIKVRAK